MKKNDELESNIIGDYLTNRKYFCSKCRFYEEGRCTKNRVVRECRKKRLRNV